ncbi:hypothetical protein R6Q57_023401 [Mikania cordata]
MEGYPKFKKMMIKEACEDSSLELRLCPPGDGVCSIGTNHCTRCLPEIIESKSSNKRVAHPPAVVGWPPVRRSRKNILTSSYSGKMVSLPEKASTDGSGDKKTGSDQDNSLYVKINMDGVAIGRKVDLKAYDTYEKLSSAVDELFVGLLAAQGESCCGISNKQRDMTTGLLEGSREYTLVYEDNEGDRILVGDVPWE